MYKTSAFRTIEDNSVCVCVRMSLHLKVLKKLTTVGFELKAIRDTYWLISRFFLSQRSVLPAISKLAQNA